MSRSQLPPSQTLGKILMSTYLRRRLLFDLCPFMLNQLSPTALLPLDRLAEHIPLQSNNDEYQ